MAEVLDWTKLPAALSWVAGPAGRYGHYQFDGRILAFLGRASPAELAELRAVQQRWEADHPAIQGWLDAYNMTEHAEARLVYFTQALLGMADEAGML